MKKIFRKKIFAFFLSALLVLAERHELSLDQMSLAVIGAGNTGECVAGKAEALGMRVLRCDPPPRAPLPPASPGTRRHRARAGRGW